MEVWVVRGWFRFVVLRYWIFFGCLNIDVRFLEDTVTDRNRCMRFHCARAPPPLQLWSSGDSWWHVLSARPSIPSGEKCFCALQSVVQWCNTGIYTARSQGFSILSLPLHSISKFNYSLLLSTIINASFLPFSYAQNSLRIKFSSDNLLYFSKKYLITTIENSLSLFLKILRNRVRKNRTITDSLKNI